MKQSAGSRSLSRVSFSAIVILLIFLFVTFSTSSLALLASRASAARRFARDELRGRLIANAHRKLAERAAWLSPQHSEHAQFRSLPLASSPGWYIFSPVLPCDGTFEKEPSSDKRHDGGKWLCGLQEEAAAAAAAAPGARGGRAHPPCAIYSFGSNNEFSFEERVHALVPHCEVHTFDPTSSPPPVDSPAAQFVQFHADAGLAGVAEAASAVRPFAVQTLAGLQAALGHRTLLVLKIDIEGSEWGVIAKTDWRSVRAAQISFELHPQFGGGPTTVGEAVAYFERLEDSGYYLASLEPVTYTNYGQVEVVFIHRDFVPGEPWPRD
jgi:hypothetical protein